MLSEEELERYSRNILLKDIGGAGQQKLKQAKVLVVGAGGLGSPVLMYLAAAGVGTLGIIDDDRVDLSNLQRQIIHTTNRVGELKTASATLAIAELNPNIKVKCHTERLTADNALDIIGAYDIVADGCDNFATRYLVNDACYLVKRPLVSAAVSQFEGQLTTFRAYEKGDDGNPNPSYRCLYSQPPPSDQMLSCQEAGILGALTGVIGSLQALEVIKEILNMEGTLVGRLLLYNALNVWFRTIRYKWDQNNPLNGCNPTIKDLSSHQKSPGHTAPI